MSSRPALDNLIAVVGARVNDAELQRALEAVREEMANPDVLFVNVVDGVVNDVSSERWDLEVYVIDESRNDTDGVPVQIDTEDDGSFPAHVKRMQPTSVHFDAEQVKEAAAGNAFANGNPI